MGNIAIQSNPTLTTIGTQKQAAPAKAGESAPAPAPAQASLSKDVVKWQDVSKGERIKTAIATTFKNEVIPYTVGGALAAPAAGALLGGFVGAFSGNAGKYAWEGAKYALKFAPITGAMGAGAAGVDALAIGTAVGSSKDRHSAMVTVGAGSAILGLLSSNDKWDMLASGVGAAAESARAGKVYDKTLEALQKK